MRLLKIHTLDSAKKWVDRDFIMLHACFQILVDFMEKEFESDNRDEEHYKVEIQELKDLYKWWKEDRKADEDFEQQQLERLIKLRNFLWI